MRIALLHPSLTWRGGAERQMLNLAIELQRAGNEVEIFTTSVNNQCYPEILRQLTINVIHLPMLQIKLVKSSQERTAINRLLGRFQNYTDNLPAMLYIGKKIPKGFDIINNHNFPTEWAAFFAKKRLNAPIVWMCNEPPFWFSDASKRKGLGKINLPLFEGLDKLAVDYIDEIVVLSALAGNRVEKAYGRTTKIVRSGLNTDLFHKASGKEFRAKRGLENSFVLLQVGNIARDKRQKDSLLALKILSKKHDNVRLVLDGEGSTEELIDLSRKLGVEGKVLLLHSCSDEELAQVYAGCDVFVFPAQITWGLAVIEAMAASKPVIVSRKAGASEIIQSGRNGIVIDEPNHVHMAAHIERLIADADLRKKIGAEAYRYIVENFSWKIYAKNMEVVFRQAVKNYRKNA